ncbi:MAG: AraC family transcriptional regulator [Pseudomonadota bacterium]
MTTRHHPRLILILLSTVLWLPIAAYTEDQLALQESIQDIKQQALELNRDLFILEEELLFPDNTQLAIYVSMDADELFTLDAVKLSIDGVVVTNYLYTERQVDALQRGGVQRLYMGNMKAGEHEIVAVFTGRGPQGRDFRRATQLVVEKANGAKNLEVKILGSQAMQQPEFSVKEW